MSAADTTIWNIRKLDSNSQLYVLRNRIEDAQSTIRIYMERIEELEKNERIRKNVS